MMNPITIHSLVQHALNMIGTQHLISSQVMIPPPGVPVQQITVIVPHFVVMVSHQPQSTTWAPRLQHPLITLVQPSIGQVHQPLVDNNLPPLEGQPPYVAPPLVTHGATIGQPGWKQPPPLSQPLN